VTGVQTCALPISRARAEIGSPLPRPWLGIHENDPFPGSRLPFPEMDPRFAQRGVEHVARPDGIRSADVVVYDRHRRWRADAWGLAPHQVRRAVGDAVGEGGVRGEVRLPLGRRIAPLLHGRLVAPA